MRRRLANMMGHGVMTRKNCYVRSSCTKTAAAAMDIIERVTKPTLNDDKPSSSTETKTKTPSETAETTPETAYAKVALSTECTLPTQEPTPRTSGTTQTKAKAAANEETLTQTRPQPAPVRAATTSEPATYDTSGHTWWVINDITRHAARELFAKELQSGNQLRINEVRNKMCTHNLLRPHACYKTRVLQVVEYLNTIATTTPPSTNIPSIPQQSATDEWLSGLESQSTRSTTSGRQYWDQDDTAFLENRFADDLKSYQRFDIKSLFLKEDRLRQILEQEGVDRC